MRWNDITDLDPGYAITIQKSQTSVLEVLIIPFLAHIFFVSSGNPEKKRVQGNTGSNKRDFVKGFGDVSGVIPTFCRMVPFFGIYSMLFLLSL
jgi:hypothetical protein